MNTNEILKNKYIPIRMNQIGISTKEKPIIGTQSLGPCMAIILYSKEGKRAIVAHIPTSLLLTDENLKMIREVIEKKVNDNNLSNFSFELMLIEGAQKSQEFRAWYDLDILMDLKKRIYSAFEILEINLTKLEGINITSIKKTFTENEVQTVYIQNEPSKEFAFNANAGKFLTSEIFKNEETLEFKQGTHHI